MASAPTSPLQLITGKSPWYPTHEAALPERTNYALRRVFDNVYQLAGSLLPLGVAATGIGTLVVPAAPTPPATIPNCQITFSRAGLWLVTGVFSIQVLDAGDLNFAFNGALLVQGTQQPAGQSVVPSAIQPAKAILLVQAQPETHTIAQVWAVRVNANATARLQIQKATGATGTHSLVDAANSAVIATWCGL